MQSVWAVFFFEIIISTREQQIIIWVSVYAPICLVRRTNCVPSLLTIV